MKIEPAERLSHLPVYLFDDLDNQKAAAISKGIDVIDLGVGDPDRPTPDYIIDVLCEKARDDRYHHYPSFKGLPEYRNAVSGWYSSVEQALAASASSASRSRRRLGGSRMGWGVFMGEALRWIGQ